MDRSSCSQRSPGAAVLTNATMNGKVPALCDVLHCPKQAVGDIGDFRKREIKGVANMIQQS
jgi:hypothetical protein